MSFEALVVEDDATAARIATDLLTTIGFKVTAVYSFESAESVIASGKGWALFIVDERLPDGSGLDLVVKIRAAYPDATIAVSTVVDDQSAIRRALAAGCNYFVVKPNGMKRLLASRHTPELLLDAKAQELVTGR